MTTISTFPNGEQLTSTALTAQAMSTLFQQLAGQILGVQAQPFTGGVTLIEGQFVGTVSSTAGLYQGLFVSGPGLPDFTVVIDDILSQTEILLSSAASASGDMELTFTDPEPYSKVRIEWPTTGQPAFRISDNVCFIKAVEVDDSYGMIRDVQYPQASETSLSQTTTYTRVWRVDFINYGPASFDNARLIRSAVLLDFAHDFIAASNVYLIPDTPSPKRIPYEFNSQWWERTDLSLRFNEFVTETTTVNQGASVEVIISNDTGTVAEFEVS